MKKLWKHFLHLITGAVAKFISNIHMPWSRKKIKYSDILKLKEVLQPGDIILTRTHGEFTTFAIPGTWKHAAIYTKLDIIADATRAGVSERYLVDLCLKADRVAAFRVKNITEEERENLVDYSKTHIGKEYDFEMWATNPDELFCSEYIMVCVNYIRANYLEFRERSGLQTFTPQDIADAKKKFTVIWESHK